MRVRHLRRHLAAASALVLAVTGLTALAASPAYAAVACEVDFQADEWNDGGGGFTAAITIQNLGEPVDAWTLAFDMPGNPSLVHGWSAHWSAGDPFTAASLEWNGGLGTGDSVGLGFNGSGYAGAPTEFTLNGVVCDGGPPQEDPPPEVSLTSPSAGQQFTAGSAVELAADASSDAGIDRVDFLIDGEQVGSDQTVPYSLTMDDLATGDYRATAVAYDAGDPQQSSESSTVAFSVVELPDPTVLASPGSLSLVTGDSAPVTLRLSEAPGGSVTVDVATTGNVDADPTSVTLTDSTFDTGAQVDVAGLAAGAGTVTASADGYDEAAIAVTVSDDTGPPPRADNPYDGADVYVDPVWGQKVQDQAADTGGALGSAMSEVATYPTFVWMDRIGAITDGIGLTGHLDNAVAQDAANGDTPTVFQVVIYNLPNRDCAADASNGELLISENGFEIYREGYVDVIAGILSRPEYANLRVSAVIEVDSLPNLVTNTDVPACQEAAGDGGYRDGIRYVLNSLADLPNVYSYLDIAHSGWLGWDSNFGPAVDLYIETLTSSAFYGPAPGLDSVAGFVTNSANYTPTVEPFLPDSSQTPPGGGNPIRSADFFEWNPYFDELTFTQDLHDEFSSRGMDGFGILIDTGRNGWGGPDRPSEVSDATDVNTYVDESRVDRRPHRGGWCNQAGAGIGERPTTSPADGIDAYVWVKPPGESDGVSDPDFEQDPNDPNKKHDAMCDPEGQSTYDPSKPTNALPNAPHAGRWFPEQFEMLVSNAYPAF